MSLPQGWQATTVGAIADLVRGVTYDKASAQGVSEEGYLPIARATNIQGGRLDKRDLVYVPANFADERQMLRAGDIVIATSSGSRSVVGKAAQAHPEHEGMSFGAFCGVARAVDAETGAWLARVFETDEYRSFVESVAIGTNINNLRTRDLQDYVLPLPPMAEQRRIVAKLDALTARLTRARAELDRVPVLAGKLRRLALSKALEGRLVESAGSHEWTEDHREALSERRAAYLRNRRGSRLRSDVDETVAFLDGPRSAWLDCRLADVISLRLGYAFKSGDFSKVEGVPLLRGANISPGRVDWADQVRLRADVATTFAGYTLVAGDIVIAMDRPVISTGLKIARIYESDAGCLLVQRVANPRPTEWIDAEYLMVVLQSDLFLDQIENHATGTDLPHISGNDILTTPCPLPPIDVQKQIARATCAAFARAERLEAEAARCRALLDRLEGAILSRAFRGQLVPQDPSDEPASALLARIRAQRTGAPKAKRGRPAKAA